jgi:5-methylcytosine-specific restriction endonuclease McrA
VFCGVALVMPDDWDRLRRSDPCVLPSAVLVNRVARAQSGGALGLAQRAPIIGYRHQFEHLIPRSRGGGNTPDNIVSACGWCNRAKRTYTLTELGLPTPQL